MLLIMNKTHRNQRRPENAELRRSIDVLLNEGDSFLKKSLESLDISHYCYDIDEAVAELDLDEDIIRQLLEDYVIQILKSKITFYKYVQELKQAELDNIDLDYTKIRELAHKNLGVARNLRIKDAKKIIGNLENKPKIVVDIGGGAAKDFAPELLRVIGCDVQVINENISECSRGPDPTSDNLSELIKIGRAHV